MEFYEYFIVINLKYRVFSWDKINNFYGYPCVTFIAWWFVTYIHQQILLEWLHAVRDLRQAWWYNKWVAGTSRRVWRQVIAWEMYLHMGNSIKVHLQEIRDEDVGWIAVADYCEHDRETSYFMESEKSEPPVCSQRLLCGIGSQHLRSAPFLQQSFV